MERGGYYFPNPDLFSLYVEGHTTLYVLVEIDICLIGSKGFDFFGQADFPSWNFHTKLFLNGLRDLQRGHAPEYFPFCSGFGTDPDNFIMEGINQFLVFGQFFQFTGFFSFQNMVERLPSGRIGDFSQSLWNEEIAGITRFYRYYVVFFT